MLKRILRLPFNLQVMTIESAVQSDQTWRRGTYRTNESASNNYMSKKLIDRLKANYNAILIFDSRILDSYRFSCFQATGPCRLQASGGSRRDNSKLRRGAGCLTPSMWSSRSLKSLPYKSKCHHFNHRSDFDMVSDEYAFKCLRSSSHDFLNRFQHKTVVELFLTQP